MGHLSPGKATWLTAKATWLTAIITWLTAKAKLTGVDRRGWWTGQWVLSHGHGEKYRGTDLGMGTRGS